MSLRHSLDLPWDTFVTEWCLGVPPDVEPDVVHASLEALERHLPQSLDALESSGQRGLIPLLWVLHVGNAVALTERLPGFDAVINRVRKGDNAAIAEIEVAAAVVRIGIEPDLGAPLAGKLLDASFVYDGRTHYVEVVSLERADAIREAQAHIGRVSQVVMHANPAMEIEVTLHSDVDTPESVADTIKASDADSSLRIAGTISFRKSAFEASAWSPGTASDDPRPVLVCVHGDVKQGVPISRVTVRLPISDDRAKRVLDAERHHFSRDQPNLLIVNISRVVNSVDAWSGLICRCFQPTQNRRLGAVILYSTALVAGYERIWQRWRVVENPFAAVPIATDVLTAFRALDDGPYPGTVP